MANLEGANLEGANFDGAEMENVNFRASQNLPLSVKGGEIK